MDPKHEVENDKGLVMKVEVTRNSNKYEGREPEKNHPQCPYGKLIRFIVECMIVTLGSAKKPLDRSA
jgi:hypothetical protein